MEVGRMTQVTVGVRELKAQLSRYVRQVRAGATLVITDRGEPVGRIVPLGTTAEMRQRELIEIGMAAWSGQRLSSPPRVVRARGDRTVADLLLEDRE
jgi:prevent-host-death family protein